MFGTFPCCTLCVAWVRGVCYAFLLTGGLCCVACPHGFLWFALLHLSLLVAIRAY